MCCDTRTLPEQGAGHDPRLAHWFFLSPGTPTTIVINHARECHRSLGGKPQNALVIGKYRENYVAYESPQRPTKGCTAGAQCPQGRSAGAGGSRGNGQQAHSGHRPKRGQPGTHSHSDTLSHKTPPLPGLLLSSWVGRVRHNRSRVAPLDTGVLWEQKCSVKGGWPWKSGRPWETAKGPSGNGPLKDLGQFEVGRPSIPQKPGFLQCTWMFCLAQARA